MTYTDYLDIFRREGRLRSIPQDGSEPRIDLLSNDYLGLAAREKDFHEEFFDRFGDAQFSSSASRLLSRRQKYHNMLEEMLSRLYGRPALLFNSGYHANVGLIQALATEGTWILSDRLIHASSIDGIRLSGAKFTRFPHNDIAAIERALEKGACQYERVILLTEGIFSMDGDLAPLEGLVALKKRYPNLMLAVDEAHAFGVLGERGLGLSEQLNLIPEVDIIIGTLGKAAASSGAFVVASDPIIQYLLNTARSFIFSTAIPPISCAWSVLMIEKILVAQDLRKNLEKVSNSFRKHLEEATGIATPSNSQIVPLLIGDAAKAVEMSRHIQSAGFDALAIRRPTVPAGGERIRFSLNAALTEDSLQPLVDFIGNYGN